MITLMFIVIVLGLLFAFLVWVMDVSDWNWG